MVHYYVWNGVGAVEDLDGTDHPLPASETDALQVFAAVCAGRTGDLTLWARDQTGARLLGVRFSGPTAVTCRP